MNIAEVNPRQLVYLWLCNLQLMQVTVAILDVSLALGGAKLDFSSFSYLLPFR
jgi:hypothetical protein